MRTIKKFSDSRVLETLKGVTKVETEMLVTTISCLIEVDRRGLYLSQGYSSLYSYCVGALRYCEGTAGRRVIVVRCVQKFPSLLRLLRLNKLTVSTVVAISKILTEESYKFVVRSVIDRSKSEVERFVATQLPKINIPEVVRPIPSNLSNLADSTGGGKTSPDSINNEDGPDFEIRIQASPSAIPKLRRVQELRGGKESLGKLFEKLLDVYLDKYAPESRIRRRNEKEKLAARSPKEPEVQNPAPFQGNHESDIKVEAVQPASTAIPLNSAPSRFIPQSVKDAVYIKYQGQCCFVSPSGKRCKSTHQLQIDHIKPFAKGGSNDSRNLRLLCRAHNRYMAELAFGKEKMSKYTGVPLEAGDKG